MYTRHTHTLVDTWSKGERGNIEKGVNREEGANMRGGANMEVNNEKGGSGVMGRGGEGCYKIVYK